jgi:hypothetical protein
MGGGAGEMSTEPKYRNGTPVKVGDIAIGCWHPTGDCKLAATVVVVAVHPKESLVENVSFVYLNGNPGDVIGPKKASSDVMVLLEDVFAGDVDQFPEKSWLDKSREETP